MTRIEDVCQHFLPDCTPTVIFRDAAGRALGSTVVEETGDIFGGPNRCRFTARLVDDCTEPNPIARGETIKGVLHVGLRPGGLPPKTCVDLMCTINGRTTRLTTLCGDETWTSERRPLSGTLACYGLAAVGTNGVTGTTTPIGCVRTAETGPPAPPTLTDLRFGEQQVQVGWRSPPQETGGVFLEWRQVGGEARGTRFVSYAGRFGGGLTHDFSIDAPPIGDHPEQWCVRARSVGRGQDPTGAVSAWSADVCADRLPPAVEPPPFLGWPDIPAVPQTGTLAARFILPEKLLAVALSDLDGPAVTCQSNAARATPPLFPCGPDDLNLDCGYDVARIFTGCDVCGQVNAALGENRRFVAYRQRRHPDGRLDAYVQVSPLIERMYCEASCSDPFGCEDPDNDPYFFCAQQENVEDACAQGATPQGVFDPYLKLLSFHIDDPWPQNTLAFIDRTPYAFGAEYRYQFVFFDGRDEISGRKTTPWISITEEQ